MSAGGYDTPHISASLPRYDSRRSSGNIPSSYDRPTVPRRRTPSPGPSRRPYDSYVPERFELPYRDTQHIAYRPNNYRPGSSGWVSRSPSPDHYEPPARHSDSDYWERTSSWRGPPPPDEFVNRKSIPSSPSTSSARGRDQRDDAMSTRSFENSNSWKQTQADRYSRMDSFLASDRYNDRRGRRSFERSPDGPMRTDRASASLSSDCYRPPPKRESHPPPGRSDYDSYRPHYDNHWSPPRREPVSPSGSHNRRDSGSISHSRKSDRFDTPPHPRYFPRKNTHSPVPIISPTHSPDSSRWTAPESDNAGWSYSASLDPTKRQVPPPRPTSRSSIASTQVSDRKSSPPTETPSVVQPITPGVTTTSIVAVDGAIRKEEDTMPKLNDINIQPNGETIENAHNDITVDSLTDGVADPISIPSTVTKPATNTALVSPKDSVKNTSNFLGESSSIASKDQVSREIIADAIAATSKSTINGIHESLAISSATPAFTTDSDDTSSKSPLLVQETPEAVKNGSRSQEPSFSVVRSSQPEMNNNSMDDDVEPEEPSRDSLSTSLPIPAAKSTLSQTPIPTFNSRPFPKSDEIPPLSDAKSKADALRIVVMTRLLCDHQSREERIDPVLMANLSIASPPEVHPTSNPGMLLIKMNAGQPLVNRMSSFAATRPSIVMYLEQRQALATDKIGRLREEYLSLHENWVAHCTALNEQQKTLASEHEMQHGGRTTRRSTAITDAVRSDFEMEQIIASLGNDDATDPNHLSVRNLAKVPDMISVVNGKVDYLFDDTADRVENPSEYFDTGIDDWTEAEKKIYLDKFAAHPKQFGIIADALPNKTARQCVDYYYLHKKGLINFRQVVSQFAPNKRKRRGMGKRKGNGLLADIAMHDAEVHRDLGSNSAVSRVRGRRLAQAKGPPSVRNAVQFEVTPTSTPTPEPETRPRRRRMLDRATPRLPNNSISVVRRRMLNSATMSSITSSSISTVNTIPAASASISTFRAAVHKFTAPITSASAPFKSAPPIIQYVPPAAEEDDEAAEPDPEHRPAKRPKRTRKIKSAATVSDEHLSPGPEVPTANPVAGNVTESGARGKKVAPHTPQWSEEDKNLFLSLLAQYGADFKRIAASMPSRTTIQVSNYYKSNLTELDLEKVAATAPERSPTPTHRESRKERKTLAFSTSVTLTPSVPVPVPTSMPALTPLTSAPMAIFGESTGMPRQPTSPTSTFPGRNVSAGKPLSSDGIIHSPPPSWSSPLPSSRPVSRISQPLSRPNHNATASIRHPGYFAMDTRPEYPPDPRSYGKSPDNVNLSRGPIGQYGRPSETSQYLPATYSPPEVSSNGRGYRPPGPNHDSSPIMTHPNAMPLSQNVRTPYAYPPTGDHRNSVPMPSSHNPPGRSPHMYPSEHSTYAGSPPLYEGGRSPNARYTYPPTRPESLQRSPPFNTHSDPTLKRRLDPPPYPDYPNTIVASPTSASSSTRTPSRPLNSYYSGWDSES